MMLCFQYNLDDLAANVAHKFRRTRTYRRLAYLGDIAIHHILNAGYFSSKYSCRPPRVHFHSRELTRAPRLIACLCIYIQTAKSDGGLPPVGQLRIFWGLSWEIVDSFPAAKRETRAARSGKRPMKNARLLSGSKRVIEAKEEIYDVAESHPPDSR